MPAALDAIGLTGRPGRRPDHMRDLRRAKGRTAPSWRAADRPPCWRSPARQEADLPGDGNLREVAIIAFHGWKLARGPEVSDKWFAPVVATEDDAVVQIAGIWVKPSKSSYVEPTLRALHSFPAIRLSCWEISIKASCLTKGVVSTGVFAMSSPLSTKRICVARGMPTAAKGMASRICRPCIGRAVKLEVSNPRSEATPRLWRLKYGRPNRIPGSHRHQAMKTSRTRRFSAAFVPQGFGQATTHVQFWRPIAMARSAQSGAHCGRDLALGFWRANKGSSSTSFSVRIKRLEFRPIVETQTVNIVDKCLSR